MTMARHSKLKAGPKFELFLSVVAISGLFHDDDGTRRSQLVTTSPYLPRSRSGIALLVGGCRLSFFSHSQTKVRHPVRRRLLSKLTIAFVRLRVLSLIISATQRLAGLRSRLIRWFVGPERADLWFMVRIRASFFAANIKVTFFCVRINSGLSLIIRPYSVIKSFVGSLGSGTVSCRK